MTRQSNSSNTHSEMCVPAAGLQPKDGPRVDSTDKVEDASYDSFPASDPPSFYCCKVL